jgi:hypothetical protein
VPALRRQGLVIVATLATAYVASHFFRASNVTIGLDLMRDLAIGPEALGALTGAFFFGFSAMQIPCGFLFDRFGPRRTVTGMLLLAVVGATVFTLASGWPILLAGRALMGAGFGVMLIGSMVVISRWFPPDRFSTMAALVLSIGLVGNLLATTPLAWGTEMIGWRGVFAIVVFFTALAAIAVWLVVRDAPPDHPFLQRKVETSGEMLRGMGEVLRNPQLPFILTLNFCNYACTFTVQGLWGGPFLREVHGLTIIQSGNVLLRAARPPARYTQMDRHRRQRDDRPDSRDAGPGGRRVAVGGGGRDRRHGLLQRVQHHGHDPWPRHFPRSADRARHVDHEHLRDAGRRLHADTVGDHPRRFCTTGRWLTVGAGLSHPVRLPVRGAPGGGGHLQPCARCAAERRAARRLEGRRELRRE